VAVVLGVVSGVDGGVDVSAELLEGDVAFQTAGADAAGAAGVGAAGRGDLQFIGVADPGEFFVGP
jgi:hypothetical protein